MGRLGFRVVRGLLVGRREVVDSVVGRVVSRQFKGVGS